MAEDFHDFEVTLSFDGKTIPDWAWRSGGFHARAFRSAIEAAGGPLSEHDELATAFSHHADELMRVAQRKLVALEGMVDDEPLAIVAADIIP